PGDGVLARPSLTWRTPEGAFTRAALRFRSAFRAKAFSLRRGDDRPVTPIVTCRGCDMPSPFDQDDQPTTPPSSEWPTRPDRPAQAGPTTPPAPTRPQAAAHPAPAGPPAAGSSAWAAPPAAPPVWQA